jgi:glycosyltransferase involved in cell wall biosynthesis
MAAGLPAAVSDIGGPRELIKNSQMGRVLPARDANAWVDGLTEMLAHLLTPEEHQAVARQAGTDRKWDIAFAKLWADGL